MIILSFKVQGYYRHEIVAKARVKTIFLKQELLTLNYIYRQKYKS